MKMKPLVSVICTVYNKGPWLRQTIDSFLMQETSFPIEILLIDDASTDDSKSIIMDYAERYPDKIRTIYNIENLGIAKTWVKVCKLAEGQYIARCDGDDFWIDPLKLEKQVTLLKENPQSKWCNTDFNIYNEQGQLMSTKGFTNGTIPLADTFEKMLATRGFTMASTWLVDRELMLTVNSMLDLETSDDTFNLQLDLFQHTELTYLDEATVGYVINQGSDSRPNDFSKIEHRFNSLLETQKYYIDKYPDSNYRTMLDILLERNNRYEIELTKKESGLAQFGIEKVTIYFMNNGQGFSQDNILQIPLAKTSEIAIRLPDGCRNIRIDLSEKPSFYAYAQLVSTSSETEVLPSFTNAIVLGNSYIFPNADPQLIYEIPESFGRDFILRYKTYNVDDIHSEDYIAKILGQELLDEKIKVRELEDLRLQTIQQSRIIAQQQKDLETITNQYHSVIGSRRWIIPTKIINFFRRNK